MSHRRMPPLAAAAASLILLTSSPALGAGIVFDPSNYAQNVLTAARALQQINNQITALQNQAVALNNQARNLASLPLSSLTALQSQIRQTQTLIQQAQGLAYQVDAIDRGFTQRYSAGDVTASDQSLIAAAKARWQDSVASFEDALKLQAGVLGHLDGTREQMTQLVSASQSAAGALQAAQAGNQLTALQTQQLADLTALLAAQGRAQALAAARQAAGEDQAREQLRRFVQPGPGYQPAPVQMFHAPAGPRP